jgi:ubiquinone/menaquinone biosynthesis C-methylase UbiE
MKAFLRLFFKLLYHQFAFAYDFVAAAVSFNRWKEWVEEVIPFIRGTRILEIGHGPGHLQRILLSRGLVTVGIDESSQMGQLAKHRMHGTARLTRGLAQQLPFADSIFDTVVSTFPSEYIFDPRTMLEVKRCLSEGGRFIVLPIALPKNKFLDWLYKITGETPSQSMEGMKRKLREPFSEARFSVQTRTVNAGSSFLIIAVATK